MFDGRISDDQISRTDKPVRQGDEVFFHFPYALGSSLRSFQHGVVLSSDHYNRVSNRLCICPISVAGDAADKKYGIPIQRPSGRIDYLRPDAASFLDSDYCNLATKTERGLPVRLPLPDLAAAIARFTLALTPTPEKVYQAPDGCLGFGHIGWLYKIPRITEDVQDSAPVMGLTPPREAREKGFMLVARGYSNIRRYAPRYDVALPDQQWFGLGFFSASGIHAIDLHAPDKQHAARPFKLTERDFRDLRGMRRKAAGLVDPLVRREVLARYSDRIGELPEFIVTRMRSTCRDKRPAPR